MADHPPQQKSTSLTTDQSAAVAALAGPGTVAARLITFGPASGMAAGQKLQIPCGTLSDPKKVWLQAQISGAPASALEGYTLVDVTGMTAVQVQQAMRTAILAVTGHNLDIPASDTATITLTQLSPGAFGNGEIASSLGGATVTTVTVGANRLQEFESLDILPRFTNDAICVGPLGKSLTFVPLPGNPKHRLAASHHPTQPGDQVLALTHNLRMINGYTAYAQDDVALPSFSLQWESKWTDPNPQSEWMLNYFAAGGAHVARALTHLYDHITQRSFWGFGARSFAEAGGYKYELQMDHTGIKILQQLTIDGLAGAGNRGLVVNSDGKLIVEEGVEGSGVVPAGGWATLDASAAIPADWAASAWITVSRTAAPTLLVTLRLNGSDATAPDGTTFGAWTGGHAQIAQVSSAGWTQCHIRLDPQDSDGYRTIYIETYAAANPTASIRGAGRVQVGALTSLGVNLGDELRIGTTVRLVGRPGRNAWEW